MMICHHILPECCQWLFIYICCTIFGGILKYQEQIVSQQCMFIKIFNFRRRAEGIFVQDIYIWVEKEISIIKLDYSIQESQKQYILLNWMYKFIVLYTWIHEFIIYCLLKITKIFFLNKYGSTREHQHKETLYSNGSLITYSTFHISRTEFFYFSITVILKNLFLNFCIACESKLIWFCLFKQICKVIYFDSICWIQN